MVDVLRAMPVIIDPAMRAQLYSKIRPIVAKVPEGLSSNGEKGTKARYVRIELPGNQRILTLAEVEVYSGGVNIAPKGTATQSSTAFKANASRAIDGNKNPSFTAQGQTHTKQTTKNPWWQLDLGRDIEIEKIDIYNRIEGNLGSRLNNYSLILLDDAGVEVMKLDKQKAPKVSVSHSVGPAITDNMIRGLAAMALTYVRGQESDSFNAISPMVSQASVRDAAIKSLLKIKPNYWPKDEASSLLGHVLGYIAEIPKDKRTSESAINALSFGESLTRLLPADQAVAARKKLGELGVPIVRIGTKPHRMLFDKDIFAVQAGKQVEIVIENNDIMPHNLVITRPGKLIEIGELGENTASNAGVIRNGYVPRSKDILFGSKLLQPQEMQKKSFQVPTEPGIYPYVCTYPGHWRRMYGAMFVVADLEAYLLDPQKYLADNPLEFKDDMLKNRRPRTEWKFADLKESVKLASEGRSYESGKQMFTVANCIACHQMDGVGKEFGPDLKKFDEKWTTEDLWREIVEPSHRINEKYSSFSVETEEGEVITGLIVEENSKSIKIVVDPLVKVEPREILKSEIFEREKSKVSLMPKGMVDELTEEEILDVVAYLMSRGDKNHPLFKGGVHDHSGTGHGKKH